MLDRQIQIVLTPLGRTLLVLGLCGIGGLLFGCAGPSRLAVDPTTGSLDRDTSTSALPSRDALFHDCSAVTLGKGVYEVQCRDLYRFYGARYDVPFSADRCRTVIQRMHEDVTLREGPPLGLPDSAYTYQLTGMAKPRGPGSVGTKGFGACVPHRDGGVGMLFSQEGVRPDSSYAAAVLTTLAYEGVPDDRLNSRTPTEVSFLGRTLPVHSSCELKGAQNLSCFPNGQMNWGAFTTLDRARDAQSIQIQSSRQSVTSVLADTTVGCTFEGTETRCRRIVYRAPMSRLATLGATNVLIAFYAVARVRGRPARAVCSFYRDQAHANGLAPLCQEAFDVPAADTLMRRTPK